MTVIQLFEEIVSKYGERIALSGIDEQLSYQELNSKANQLARHLVAKGVQKNSHVGLSCERSIDMIVGILGILKTGAAYVPIDSQYPIERKRYIIKDAAISVLITQQKFVEEFPDERLQFVCLDSEHDALEQYPTSNSVCKSSSTDIAYIYYTSGSTGKPKGVRVPHSGIIRLVRNTNWISILPEDHFLQIQNISFDGSTFEIWGALLNGAHLHIFPPGKVSLENLARHVVQERINILLLTTRLFNLMVEEQLDSFKGLRYLCTGGEAMSLRHTRMAFQALENCKIVNVYGPTENTTFTTIYCVSDSISQETEVPIGKPVNNTTVYILNEQLEQVPMGVVGELCTGGDGLAIGYLNQEALTKEKFIPNPFGEGLLYRTGDLACLREDGEYLYRGRIDDQVKIRGFRIELGEIEETLRSHKEIVDCAVITREDDAHHLQIIAYVQTHEGLDSNTFREFLASKLPEFMIPTHILCLPKLPLTQVGKIDRSALPKIPQQIQQSKAPKTKMEGIVLASLIDLFGWQNAGIQDHFFKMGGDSLGAMKLVSKLRKLLEIEISIDLIFQNPVIADFAYHLEHHCQKSTPFCRKNKSSTVLSFNQEALWIEDQFAPGSTHYAIPLAFHLKGKLNQSRLQNALDLIVERHEILRTRYDLQGQPIVDAKIPTILHWQATANFEDAMAMLQKKASQPFNLKEGPVIYFYVYQISETDHLVLFYVHHILVDDFAIQQFFKELTASYSNIDLSPSSIQYSDFASWQREFLQTKAAEKQINYWKNQLKNPPELLELPWDKARPSQLSRKGRTCQLELEANLINQLDELAKKYSVSKFVVFLSLYLILLHRYSGKKDLLVGTPFANRNYPELESLIGFCSQMMVIRADFSKNPSFQELFAQVNQLVVEAQENVGIPFEKIVEELNPSRNSGYNPLFQVGFGFENCDDLKLHLEGIETQHLEVRNTAAKFDLFFTVKKADNHFSCHLEYSTDLFEEVTIRRMLNHYVSLMKAMVVQPAKKVGMVPILTEKEAKQFLEDWNQTAKPYPRETINRRFEEIAEKYPDHTAICYRNSTLTYKTLNDKSNQIARHLLSFGIQKGECIGVASDRSPELIIALLAILKAGAVFIPIDSSYPEDRRTYILDDSAIHIVLTQSDSQALFPGRKVFPIENLEPTLDSSNLTLEAEINSLSHVFYTSGSTGKPKGVKLTHQGVLCLVTDSDWFPIKPNDRILQFSNISFDLMILEIWGALLNGAALCIYPHKEIVLEKIGKQLVTENITHAIFTPRVLNLLIEEYLTSLKGLRYLVSAGEAMSLHHAKLAYDGLPKCCIINGYGPTETNFATAYAISEIKRSDHSIPIGKPLANMTTYLLNEFLQPVPLGVIGELYIGGDTLALGYQNRPELTAERFIENPFGTGYLYRTGDLCRLRCDGNLLYADRIDTQVKVRGFRVELGEIEEVLKSHCFVNDCVVLAKNDSLAAYVVYEKKHSICEHALLEYAASKLPAYMVPSSFTALDTIPLTPNGKVDTQKLPIPQIARINDKKDSLQTAEEKAIATLWSRILQVQDICAEDHFFKLGGSSIHAIQVVSLIKKELHIDISMNLIFQYPKLRDFAKRIITANKPKIKNKIPKRNLAEPVRMPWNQESFWQIDLMIPYSSNYTMVTCFQLDGNMHLPSMKKAVQKIIARHESLRTRFEDRGDYRVQIIEDKELDVFHFSDYSSLPNAEERANAHLDEVFQTPFDLQKLPLIGFHLIKIGNEKFLGALYVHHIVFDGWSIGVFFKELRTFYSDFLHDRAIVTPDPIIQHPDFASWQTAFLQSKAAKKQINYWKKQIQGTKLIELPWDFERPAQFKGGGDIIQWSLPSKLSADLKQTAKELGVTLYELVLAAYKVLLYDYSGQNDLLIGSPFANRTQEELEPLLGFFIHMFAIRTQLKGDASFTSFLHQVSQTMAKAYENCDVPCETIFAELYPNWNPTFNRFQIGFSLDTISPSEEDFEGLKTTWMSRTNTQGKFDFYLGVIVDSQVINFNMYYCSDLYLRKTVEEMLNNLQTLLSAIVINPKQKIDQLLKTKVKTDVEL